MPLMKKYKKEVESITTTNLAFNSIKDKLIMKDETKTNRSRILWPSLIGGAALIATSTILVVALTMNKTGGTNLVPNDPKLSMKAIAKSATPLLSFQSSASEVAVKKNLNSLLNTTLSRVDKTNEEIIQELLYQFDTIIENDDNYKVEAVESDKEEYKYKEIITFKDLLNNSTSYSLYYNELLIGEDVDDNDDDDNEIERETTYKGLAVKNDQEFEFKLELEEGYEGDETEIESTFYLYESKTTFTKVTSSSEIEGLEKETEYSYEIYEDGSLITSYEMEIEHDPEDNEVELSIELNEKGFSVERVIENGETYFYVEFENDNTDEEINGFIKRQ